MIIHHYKVKIFRYDLKYHFYPVKPSKIFKKTLHYTAIRSLILLASSLSQDYVSLINYTARHV